MATGVKPRDEESQITRSDLEVIQEALKKKEFRDLLADYCDEIRDPANQAIYQKEMTQLEKERGYDITFINPKGGYVIKTSVAGDRKAFINICSNDAVAKPTCNVQIVKGRKGMSWQIPYSLIPPREDYSSKKERCVIYDVVFHPDTLRMAEQNKQFRDLVNKTAFDALKSAYNIHLDYNNCRFPKSVYKGMANPAVIRKEDPNFKAPTDEQSDEISQEIIDKLYPQQTYTQDNKVDLNKNPKQARKTNEKREFSNTVEGGYTVPKYTLKQQKNIDLQDFTYEKDCKQHSVIPNLLVIEINLPLLSSTKDCTLDVQEKKLSLVSEKPAKYKLNLNLPYPVNDQNGNAKFDKSKNKLIVTLPVIRKHYSSERNSKADSGVESEENSGSQSDEDKENLVEVISSTPAQQTTHSVSQGVSEKEEIFINPSIGYILPSYTHNVLDGTIAFTFHVKNTEPDSVQIKQDNHKIYIKFTSVGSGFVPIHYAATIVLDEHVRFETVSGEAWDNNVILQMEVASEMPQTFQIGLTELSLSTDHFEVTPKVAALKVEPEVMKEDVEETQSPTIEVTNFGSETNIVVSTNEAESCEDQSPDCLEEIVWTEDVNNRSSAKSILRKPMSRSYSESSMGDVASSMDYISSDCIPEESSLKKTVRFSKVIAKQFYRHNSSIEGQKKKNQRKKSKKRNLERRKSESEAEDDNVNSICMNTKPKAKSALKLRRDSGLADTSDAETENKNTPDDDSVFTDNRDKQQDPLLWETKRAGDSKNKANCDSIKHKTDLYNPDNLNKGKYLEVKFRNDLIFDLDM